MPIFHTIRDIYQEMRAKRWLAVALAVEALGLVGAIGSIPTVGLLPLIWTLAVVGLLSTVGILIVTAHYVWEYNRRPLNSTQRAEVEELLAPFFSSEDAKSLPTKSELLDLVPESKLFWLTRYQTSVMELGWTADLSLRQPGYVLVAELHGTDSLTKKIGIVGEFYRTEPENPPNPSNLTVESKGILPNQLQKGAHSPESRICRHRENTPL